MPNKDLGTRIEDLKALRDEVALKAHLAEMDVRDRWDALRPRIDEVEVQAARAGDAAVTGLISTIDNLRSSLRALKERLEKRPH
jgi:hypothetical protein